jgi:hypothetical protein
MTKGNTKSRYAFSARQVWRVVESRSLASFFFFVLHNAGIQLFIKLTWHYVQIQAVTRFESSKLTRVQLLNISSGKTFPTPLEK